MSTTVTSDVTDLPASSAARPRVARYLAPWAFYAIALAVVALDQAVKAWVRHALPVNQPYSLWSGVFQLTHAQNHGMAFSLMEGRTAILVAAALAVAAGIVIMQVRAGRRMPLLIGIALALPLGGAFGNLIDRVWQGYVTDLFDFCLIRFPIFNVADSAITVGIALLIVRTLFVSDPPAPAAAAQVPAQERQP